MLETIVSVKIIDSGKTCLLKLRGRSLTWPNRTTSQDEIQLPLTQVIEKELWAGTTFYSTAIYNSHGYYLKSEYHLERRGDSKAKLKARRLQGGGDS